MKTPILILVLSIAALSNMGYAGDQNTSPVKQTPAKPITTTTVRDPNNQEIKYRETTRTYQDGSTSTVVRNPTTGEIIGRSSTH